MTYNPLTNALAAIAYIIVVASVMFFGANYAGPGEDTLLAPIAMISLFTLSAAVMGYIFLGTPLQLYLDDKKKEAVHLFTRTVAIFAGLTLLAVLGLFLGLGRS